MAPDAQLLSIEINPYLAGVVRRIRDERLIVHLGNASDLREIVAGYGFDKPEAVISGIPFSTMNQAPGAELLRVIESLLAPAGRFVAYQISKKIVLLSYPCSELAKPEKRLVLFNLPPLWVLQWEKIASSSEPSVH
jgi:phospholipid N-methyltransferase